MTLKFRIMKHKDFSSQLWQKIESALNEELITNPHPVAAFDADGTLWEFDLGELYFQYQIKNKLLSLPNDPWKHYKKMREKTDPIYALLWLAQIHKGTHIKTVNQWAENCFEQQKPIPVFPAQAKLIEFFKKNGVKIFIVTGSVKWAIQPGATYFNLPAENVIGVETAVDANGVISDTANGPVTWFEGKVEALMKKTQGIKPFFAIGNSMGDRALIDCATRMKVAVRSAAPGQELYTTETHLREHALQNNWEVHDF